MAVRRNVNHAAATLVGAAGRPDRADRSEQAPVETIWGDPIRLIDSAGLVHLQFRRFAASSVCKLHLRDFNSRYGEIREAGVAEVVVFHSGTEALLAHHGRLPFAVVADPGRWLYREFAVDSPTWAGFRRRRGRGSLPADFLIDGSGRVLACRQGRHPNDHWSVDELLALASEHQPDALG
jgi:peroxiredoxin